MLDVQEVRLRFIFVRALYPVPLFSKALTGEAGIYTVYFKRLTKSMFYDMLLLKMLNVSERPRTGVVPSNSDILALPKFAFKN